MSGIVPVAGPSPLVGGVPSTFVPYMQTFPKAITFTSIGVTFVNGTPLTLVGSTITLTAQLYQVPNGTLTPQAVPGFSCTLFPELTGIVGVNTVASCSASGLTGAFGAGDNGFVAISATSAGLSLVNTVNGQVTVGIGQ